MLTFRRHHRSVVQPEGVAAPWEGVHAAPEDRALGLELELIELVQQRANVGSSSDEAQVLDAAIEQALDEIAAVADTVIAA